jgi:hypothetical protein
MCVNIVVNVEVVTDGVLDDDGSHGVDKIKKYLKSFD